MTRRHALALTSLLSGCGYHISGKSDVVPKSVQTIAVPAFNNLTVRYKFADRLTGAITREFIARTRYHIIADPTQADAVLNGYNQYPSMMGIPELRQAIAAHYAHWHGVDLDPMTEVMVTSGATEALASAILAVTEPGDEVIVFQPVYDSYLPIIRQAGGIPRLVRPAIILRGAPHAERLPAGALPAELVDRGVGAQGRRRAVHGAAAQDGEPERRR